MSGADGDSETGRCRAVEMRLAAAMTSLARRSSSAAFEMVAEAETLTAAGWVCLIPRIGAATHHTPRLSSCRSTA